jgi:hypothetical protein
MTSKKKGFVVMTPTDSESFSSFEAASDWATCAVLGGYAAWADVEDLGSDRFFRVVASETLS